MFDFFDVYQNRLMFSRGFVLLAAFIILSCGIYYRRKVFLSIKGFFFEKAHPVNLSIFRIVLFAVILSLLHNSYFEFFCQMSKGLEFPVVGMGWLVRFMPFIREWAEVIFRLSQIFCITAMIGLFTRFSIGMMVLLGFIVLGMRNMLGDTYHINHVVLFSMILAVSRSGDFLSCDALMAAWRNADRGKMVPVKRSHSYCLPLRFVGLLIGIIYFFPGFWKIWRLGFDWALTDAVKYLFHWIWSMHKDWVPFFRIDRYPLLYRMSALATIVFEMSFVFLIFSKRLRYLAVGMGIIVHYLLNMFLRVSFYHLQLCYVVFFNWYKIFQYIGVRIFKDDAYLYYNGNNKRHLRIVAMLQSIDLLGRIQYLDKNTNESISFAVGQQCWQGFSVYRMIFFRMPALWWLMPFLYLLSILNNEKPANHDTTRTHEYDSARYIIEPLHNMRDRVNIISICSVGIILVLVMNLFGIKQIVKGWPFACYPTFAYNFKGHITRIEISGFDEHGIEQDVPFDVSSMWIYILFKTILQIPDEDQQNIRLTALWERIIENDPQFRNYKTIRFYKVKESTDPDIMNRQIISKKALFQLNDYNPL